jgi:hypothetical protein
MADDDEYQPDWPLSVDEAVDQLEAALRDEDQATIRAMREGEAQVALHHILGISIRSHFAYARRPHSGFTEMCQKASSHQSWEQWPNPWQKAPGCPILGGGRRFLGCSPDRPAALVVGCRPGRPVAESRATMPGARSTSRAILAGRQQRLDARCSVSRGPRSAS